MPCGTRLSTQRCKSSRTISPRTNMIGKYGAPLLRNAKQIMTHCNAGALATAGYGTALGVIRALKESGKQFEVYVNETRPFLQGAQTDCVGTQKREDPGDAGDR